MLVRDLSKRAGVSPDTVRYYVRIGLLQPVRNRQNGYQLFAEADVDRLRFIQEAKALGLTLREIRRIAATGRVDVAGMAALLEQRLADTRRRIGALTALSGRICAVLRSPTAGILRAHGQRVRPQSARLSEDGVEPCAKAVPGLGLCSCMSEVNDGPGDPSSVLVKSPPVLSKDDECCAGSFVSVGSNGS